jgi:polysaccharide export outer membrane protein
MNSLSLNCKKQIKSLIMLFTAIITIGCSSVPKSSSEISPLRKQQTPQVEAKAIEAWQHPHLDQLKLNSGDRVRVLVEDGEAFSGIFEVDLDGNIHIPYLDPIPAAKTSIRALEKHLKAQLVNQGMFKQEFVAVSIKILQWAEIQISVQGAVYKPGRVLLNQRNVEQKLQQQTQESGDFPRGRLFTAALKGAGGVRPDADLAKITLIREGEAMLLDVSGVFNGKSVVDIPLLAGDQIIVPSVGHLQPELMSLSQITPPGFQIFISNLTQPADSNAKSAVSNQPVACLTAPAYSEV